MMQHPAWCDRDGCAERDEHRSIPLQANTEPVREIRWYAAPPEQRTPLPPDVDIELLVVTARLVRFTDHTFLEVAMYDDPADADNSSFLLTLRQAELLAAGLGQLVALAGGAA